MSEKTDTNTAIADWEREEGKKPTELRVRSGGSAKALSGAIIAKVKEHGYVDLLAIGDGAIGKASRAATIASGPLRLANIDAIMRGSFFLTHIYVEKYKAEREFTGLRITVENR